MLFLKERKNVMKKKLFSILLSLTLVVTMMPMQYVDAASKTKAKAKTTVTVSTQKGLNKALKNKKLKTLTIKTSKKTNFTIPKGSHSKVSLVVDASKSTIKNYGVFSKITVNNIAKNTWKEYAKGNSIVVKSSKAHIVVQSTASVKQISVEKAKSELALEANGPVQNLEVLKKSEIIITGTVSKTKSININILEGATDSIVVSSVRTVVTTEVAAQIILSKGAEGSKVETYTEEVVNVSSTAESKVTVTNFKGEETTVSTGSGVEVNKPVTPPTGGGTGGGGTGGGGGQPQQPEQTTPVEIPTIIQYKSANNSMGFVSNYFDMVASGDAPVGSTAQPMAGCTFAYWECTINGITTSCDASEVEGGTLTPKKVNGKYVNATYTAYFTGAPSPQQPTEIKHVVTFVGKTVSTKTVTDGEQITSADAAEKVKDKTGYEFAGWFTDDEYETPAVFPYTINEDDITFYAKYNPITYTIYFHEDGADTSNDNYQVCTYDVGTNLKANTYEKDEMIFLGWSKVSSDGYNTTEYDNRQFVMNLANTSGEAVHLYAKWAEEGAEIQTGTESHSIYLNTNGIGNIRKNSFTVVSGEAYGTKFENSFCIPTAVGYEFNGWYETPECDGAEITSADAPSQDTTLFAKWTPITYKVKYNSNGASENAGMEDSTFTFGEGGYLRNNVFTKLGYEFSGWSKTPSADNVDYPNGSYVKDLTSTKDAVINLYAKWTEIQYDQVVIKYISENTEKGTVLNALETISDPINGIPTGSRAKAAEGCEFIGWTCNGVSCDATESIIPQKVNGLYKSAEYIAHFKGKPYKIKYDINNMNSYGEEGTASMTDQELEYGDQTVLKKNTFQLVGGDLAFVCWNTDPYGNGTSYADEEEVQKFFEEGNPDGQRILNDGEITLYAQWRHPIGGKMVKADGGQTISSVFISYFNFYDKDGNRMDLSRYDRGDSYSTEFFDDVAFYDIVGYDEPYDLNTVMIIATEDGMPDGKLEEQKVQFGGWGAGWSFDDKGMPTDDSYYSICDCGDCNSTATKTIWGLAKELSENEYNGCNNWVVPEGLANMDVTKWNMLNPEHKYWDKMDNTEYGDFHDYYATVYNPATRQYENKLRHDDYYAFLVRGIPEKPKTATFWSNDANNTSKTLPANVFPDGDTFEPMDSRQVFAGWIDRDNNLHYPGEQCEPNVDYKANWAYLFGGKLARNENVMDPLNYQDYDYSYWGIYDVDGKNIFKDFRNGDKTYDQFVASANAFSYFGNSNKQQTEEAMVNDLSNYFRIIATEDGTAASKILVGKGLELGGEGTGYLDGLNCLRDQFIKELSNGDRDYLLSDSTGGTNSVLSWGKNLIQNNLYDKWRFVSEITKNELGNQFDSLVDAAELEEPLWLCSENEPQIDRDVRTNFENSVGYEAIQQAVQNVPADGLGNPDGKPIKDSWPSAYSGIGRVLSGFLTEENGNDLLAIFNNGINLGIAGMTAYSNITAGSDWDNASAATNRLLQFMPETYLNSNDEDIKAKINEMKQFISDTFVGKSGWDMEKELINTVTNTYVEIVGIELRKTADQKFKIYDDHAEGEQARTEKGSVIAYMNFDSSNYKPIESVTFVINNETGETKVQKAENGYIQFRNSRGESLIENMPEDKLFVGWGFEPNGESYYSADYWGDSRSWIEDNYRNNYQPSHPEAPWDWDGKLYAQWADRIGGKVIAANENISLERLKEYSDNYDFYFDSGAINNDWLMWEWDVNQGRNVVVGINPGGARNIVAYRQKKGGEDICINGDLFLIGATDNNFNFIEAEGTVGNVSAVAEESGKSGMFNTLNAINYGAADNSGSIWDIAKSWNEFKLNGYDDWYIGNRNEMNGFFDCGWHEGNYWTSDIEGDGIYKGEWTNVYDVASSGTYKVVPIRPFEEEGVHRVFFAGANLEKKVIEPNSLVKLYGPLEYGAFAPAGMVLDKYTVNPLDATIKTYNANGVYIIKSNLVLYPQWREELL